MTRPLLTCRELIEFLDGYVDASMSEAQRSEFDRHLARCPACVAYLQNYRRVIEASLAAAAPEDAVPETVPEDLVVAVLAARNR
jgi:anti-sigma factor RsiW